VKLSLDDARWIAVGAVGLLAPRPTRAIRVADIRGAIRRLGLVQLDYVNVVTPAHYQVMFSRLGPFERSLFEKAVYSGGEFTEQWAHEASIIPVETWPLLRHRMETRRIWPSGFEAFAADHPDYASSILGRIRDAGPQTADDLPHPEGVERRLKESWFGTVPRAALEMHFARGRLAVVRRTGRLGRVFDLPERALPESCFGCDVEAHEAQRQLLMIAARAYGVATADDLADYFRMRLREVQPRVAELVERGELLPVEVEGWRARAYLHPEARVARRYSPSALISPFDPLVWYRRRAARLFHFDYRFEIFVPREKRKHGVYVLPFLLGNRLVARVDLKADRAGGRLLAPAAFLESGSDADEVAYALAAELRSMIEWLGLERVAVGRRGDLARALRAQF